MGETIQEYEKDGKVGVIVRGADGRFLPGTQPPKPITVDTARTMLARRYELAAERAAAGMAAGVKAVKAVNPAVLDGLQDDLITGDADQDAWAILNAVTTMQALQSDRPQPDTLNALGRNARMIPGKDRQGDDGNGITVTAHIPADQLLDLVTAMRQERDRRDAQTQTDDTPTT